MTQRSESGMKMWHNICFWYFEGSNLTDCKICKILEG